MLKWDGQMEEIMSHLPDDESEPILAVFSLAHRWGLNSTGSTDHARSFVELEERHLLCLGNLQRFRDQGEAMFEIGDTLYRALARPHEAASYFKRASTTSEKLTASFR